MARKFFYVCAGMFLLALSYHLGAQNATAQSADKGAGVVPRVVTRELDIVDDRGETHTTLGVAAGKPFLVMKDGAGKVRASLVLDKNDYPYLGLQDANGSVRAMLTAAYGSALSLSDSRGTERIQVATTETDMPAITLTDEDGAQLAMLAVMKTSAGNSAATILLLDKNKRTLWQVPK